MKEMITLDKIDPFSWITWKIHGRRNPLLLCPFVLDRYDTVYSYNLVPGGIDSCTISLIGRAVG